MKDITPEIEAVAAGYEYHKPPDFFVRLGDLLAQLYRWLIELLDYLRVPIHGSLDSRSASGLIQLAIFIAGACAIVAVVILMWRRVLINQAGSKRIVRGASSIERILDAAGLKLEASELSRKGEFRPACRALYLALLQLFHENDIAAFSPAKTNYEYRYLLAKYPQLKQSFIDIAEHVEPIWFGNISASQEDYDSCLSILSVVENEIPKLKNSSHSLNEG